MRPFSTRAAAALGLIAGLVSGTAHAGWAVNMPRGVTPVSQNQYDLHMLIFWICVVIGIVVFGAIFWSLIHHRKSKGAVAEQWHESMTAEIAWTVVPFMILIGMAVPATMVMIDMEDASDSDMTVKVTGYQWLWHYDYVDEDVAFYSRLSTPREAIYGEIEKPDDYLLGVDNPLVLPVGKKVRFLHTAGDVIHAWWVPEFGLKKDSIPGFINENWATAEEPGIYYGKCAELCGRGHGFMPITVKVVPEAEYGEWLALQQDGETDAAMAVVNGYFEENGEFVAER